MRAELWPECLETFQTLTAHDPPTAEQLHLLVCAAGRDANAARECAAVALRCWVDGLELMAGTLEELTKILAKVRDSQRPVLFFVSRLSQ